MLERMSSAVELPRLAGPGGGVGGMWNVVVLNDDHNTFDHVAETLARYIPGVALAEGYRLADRIHRTGSALVWSGGREDAESYWDSLDGAGLTMAPLEAA
jgi:ATP-dependent Clp protease adaptor protein ClpS